MKTTKVVLGIISMVLFIVIIFQSCVTGLANGLEGNNTDTSGGAGVLLSIMILIGGIIGVATRNSKGGGITAGIFYLIAAIIGFANQGTFGDLLIWSIMALIFGLVFIGGSLVIKKESRVDN